MKLACVGTPDGDTTTTRSTQGEELMNETGRSPTDSAFRTQLNYTEVPARIDQLSDLRHSFADWAVAQGLDRDHIDTATLATYEALSNVAAHAYPGDAPGTLDLWARYEPEQHHLEVTVTDRGHWVPPPEDPGPLGGRGIPLMRSLAEHADIEPGDRGTTVHLHWTVPA